jgi:hypothetical protein
MYSSHSFTTSALDVGEWSASRPGRALPPGKDPRYPLARRLGGPQSRSGHMLEEKSFASAGDRTPFVKYVVRHTVRPIFFQKCNRPKQLKEVRSNTIG